MLRTLVRMYAALLVRGRLWDGGAVPLVAGRYGPEDGPALPLTVLGDSSALTVGVLEGRHTNGARLAEDLVAESGCAVDLDVPARAGVTTAGMARQVAAVAARGERGVALILIGGNDVMLPVPLRRSAARLGHYVRVLRASGWEVVVGACADIGAAPALRRAARGPASRRSRALARRQTAAALGAGAVVVSLTAEEFRRRPEDLYCPDGFHPNAAGYLLYEKRALVAVAAAGRVAAGTRRELDGRPDAVFPDEWEAARNVTSEPGACFIPAQAGGPVSLHRYRPRRDVPAPGPALVPTAS
ncbi:GDSL-type esterase/lipase family protein [Streptomyces sp. DH12]|uniref:GDSL-type esterase/lipase family protein n=1 Tax=Streptomyces sp. DH12 TaxID=2857010 RepID=UPI001E2F603D|nr:GDSL-type esterase/lipase family protein [Streptomyces sp. DH12]